MHGLRYSLFVVPGYGSRTVLHVTRSVQQGWGVGIFGDSSLEIRNSEYRVPGEEK